MKVGLVSTIVGADDLLYMASAKNFCSLKAGGNFEYLVLPQSLDCLTKYLQEFKENDIKFKILGNMTNVVPTDSTMKGVFVCTKKIAEPVKVFGSRIVVACGIPLAKLCVVAKDNNLSGVEGLFGIPGTVGGAIFGNAGAFGYQIKDCLESVLVYADGKIFSRDAKTLQFDYRFSEFKKNNQIILSATFMLHNKDKHDIMATMDSLTKKRQTSQPNMPSVGSVFKKSQETPAGLLIENAGLKGMICQNMQISTKHANFIVNLGDGTCDGYKQLVKLTQEKVFEKYSIKLEREVEYIGEKNESHS